MLRVVACRSRLEALRESRRLLGTASGKSRIRHSSPRRQPSRKSLSSSSPSSNATLIVPLTPAEKLQSPSSVGSEVVLAGWLVSLRKISKNLVFAVLLLPSGRGTLQLVARSREDLLESWERAGIHGVVQVKGILVERPQESQRDSEDSFANIEVEVSESSILNSILPGSLPFDPSDTSTTTREEIRVKHRHLDLRSESLGRNIRLRSKVSWAARNYLHSQDFTEIETPILLRSTPEGAREFLVPTRTSHGTSSEPRFYALQQSPQQPKQLLVSSGVTDRYFQIARCFRDEDGRKDRQPEFTQIDLEMSFVMGKASEEDSEQGWNIGGRDVRLATEGLVRRMWEEARPWQASDLPLQFPVLRYEDAMRRFGSDKPDLRYGLEIRDISKQLSETSSGEDAHTSSNEKEKKEVGKGTVVEILCLALPIDSGKLSNLEVNELAASDDEIECFRCKQGQHNVIASLLLRKSSHVRQCLDKNGTLPEQVDVVGLSRAMEDAEQRGRRLSSPLDESGVESQRGDTMHVFVSTRGEPPSGGSTKLGDLRTRLISKLEQRGTLKPAHQKPRFVWITEFPLFTRADEDKSALLARGRFSSSHHPFTAPVEEDKEKLKSVLSGEERSEDSRAQVLAECKGQHYDLVLDGVEIGGGSVRIHEAELQELVFKNALELTKSETDRFGHLLRALRSGAPPHAGIALGFDRFMAILCQTPTIRDVLAFPKSASGADPLFESPSTISDESHTTQEALAVYGLQTKS